MTVGVVGTLWLAGVPLNPFATGAKEDPYMVRIPINAQPIPAYTRVDRMQMINAATGGLMYQKVPPVSAVGMSIVGVDQNGSHAEGRIENVKRVKDEVVFVLSDNREVRHSQTFELGGAMLNINSIIGRVVKRDKRAGLGFQETTFFPQGTPEGIAGATPAGMRAITLDATKLTGVHALSAGDQIDLLANFPVDASSGDSGSLLIPGRSTPSGKKGEATEPHLLAQKAIVLKPVYVRNEASTSASLTQGTRVQNIPKYEVAIAVKPDDLIPLQRALNQSLTITCIAHSMKPASETQSVASVEDSDTIMVPVTVHPVLAYNVVTREAFVSTATRTLKVESMSRSQVAKMDVITALDEALGAVAKHDIPAGRFLRRSDLLNGPLKQSEPKGASPGFAGSGSPRPGTPGRGAGGEGLRSKSVRESVHTFVARQSQPQIAEPSPAASAVGDRPEITRFIPAGMKAFAIPWNQVYGAEHLQIEDRIDLLVGYPLEKLKKIEETIKGPDGTIVNRTYESLEPRKTDRTWSESFGMRGEPWFVATDAVVIGPLGYPPPAPALRALGNINGSGNANQQRSAGGAGADLTGPSIIIAVADQDAENVASALVTKASLFSIAFHSKDKVGDGFREIALCPTALPAYELFDETVWTTNRRRIMKRIVSESDPRFAEAISTDEIESYYGRILGNQKLRWDVFRFTDFLSEGTSQGVAAGLEACHHVVLVPDGTIQSLDSFPTNERVTVMMRAVANLPAHVIYYGNRKLPFGEVIVSNAKIIRHSLNGGTAIQIHDEDLGRFEAAIASANQSSETTKQNSSALVAIAQPRSNAPMNTPFSTFDSHPASFNAVDSLVFTEVIVANRRSAYAFDRRSPYPTEFLNCRGPILDRPQTSMQPQRHEIKSHHGLIDSAVVATETRDE